MIFPPRNVGIRSWFEASNRKGSGLARSGNRIRGLRCRADVDQTNRTRLKTPHVKRAEPWEIRDNLQLVDKPVAPSNNHCSTWIIAISLGKTTPSTLLLTRRQARQRHVSFEFKFLPATTWSLLRDLHYCFELSGILLTRWGNVFREYGR